MMAQYTKKRRPQNDTVAAGPITQDRVQKQLTWASNSEQLKNRDPMFHITDNFMRSFDVMGSIQAQELATAMSANGPGLTDPSGKAQSNKGSTEEDEAKEGKSPIYRQTRMHEEFEENHFGQGRLMNKFSEMTFMRGKMSASVLRGTGNMMLYSSLKRTLGQSQPMKLQQRKLFQGASRGWKPMNTKASDAQSTTLLRNEVFADSAIGLVFNVTKDSRRTLDQMTELIENGGTGTETWERMMPFLCLDKEQTLIKEYQDKLDAMEPTVENENERSILNKAVTRAQTMLAKKRELRNEFMFKLRAIGGQARKACAIFSDEAFQETLKQLLNDDSTDYPEPPEGDPPPADEAPEGDSPPTTP